jgi:hypothetical protein
VGVEEFAARFVHAFVGVRAEVVALRLKQVGWQALAAEAVEGELDQCLRRGLRR